MLESSEEKNNINELREIHGLTKRRRYIWTRRGFKSSNTMRWNLPVGSNRPRIVRYMIQGGTQFTGKTYIVFFKSRNPPAPPT